MVTINTSVTDYLKLEVVPHQCGRACKLLVPEVPLLNTDRALKLHKDLEIEQGSIAIFVPIEQQGLIRSSGLTVSAFAVSSEVTLHRSHIYIEGMVEVKVVGR